MTYQELLEEFALRRANPPRKVVAGFTDSSKVTAPDYDGMINDTQWAIQSILEKLRDGDKQ